MSGLVWNATSAGTRGLVAASGGTLLSFVYIGPDYLDVVRKLESLSNVYALGAVDYAVLPYFATKITGVNTLQLSATAMLIVVGVAIDTMRQLEAQLMMRNYEGFIN